MARDNSVDGQAFLNELGGATKITLLLVPYRTSFRSRIDEVKLPEVSCVYEITAGSPAFDESLEVVREGIVLMNDAKPILDLRVGVVFERGGNVINAAYFNDFGGLRKVGGFVGSRRAIGSSDLPSLLRSLAIKPGASLVKDRYSRCPHA
ncbi:hypothetical protein [uncultured Bradyrhizobium sp.]|jgi:hypothetical protein|uniref:hypothetical protein n=1 Tax=uncultured Bradyrhizobium sp. TaxID=199684 RepID=UPI00261C8A66|nr:hypothetical protein [uncultured Bradyrhizobium sp.]